MPVIKPITRITSIRAHGLQALHDITLLHGVSNVHLLTCIVLHVLTLNQNEQAAILDNGASIDLMVRMGCRLDENGELDYPHLIPPIRSKIKEQ